MSVPAPALSLVPAPLSLVDVPVGVEDDALALPHPGDPLTLK